MNYCSVLKKYIYKKKKGVAVYWFSSKIRLAKYYWSWGVGVGVGVGG